MRAQGKVDELQDRNNPGYAENPLYQLHTIEFSQYHRLHERPQCGSDHTPSPAVVVRMRRAGTWIMSVAGRRELFQEEFWRLMDPDSGE